MKVPYTKSGKCGNMVWQRARYGQICYPAFIPYNPRSPGQIVVRANFGGVSSRWRTLTEEQRRIWCVVARKIKSKPRLLQRGPLTGFLLFVKVNVALANRGLRQVDLPLEYPLSPKLTVASLFNARRFSQLPIGPMLFLQAMQMLDGQEAEPAEFTVGVPPPA
jgi:hypothetical protein